MLVLAGILVVTTLACLAASLTLLAVWRRDALRRVEAALNQLQSELSKTNSHLENARSMIATAGAECDSAREATSGLLSGQAERTNPEQ